MTHQPASKHTPPDQTIPLSAHRHRVPSGLHVRILGCAIALGLAGPSPCLRAQQSPTLAPDQARDQRVAMLVSQMTLEEKVSQMQNHSPAIPRLGIAAYDWWSEGLHGTARSGYATLFPQAIGMAATWDVPLLHAVGTVVSVEARAKYNQAIREGNHGIYYGLTIWSPNINIFRDPRWGRGQETYGEDPFLTGSLGKTFASGLQGDDPKYLRAIATPKHFAVHSGPESERHRFNVEVAPHDLEDTYLPAFRAAVTEAHAQSIMCAYNAINGEPACANGRLLGTILRDEWKFPGFVTSDCGAVTDIAEGHKFTPGVEQAAVASVRAGTDTSCGNEYGTLTAAVRDGSIEEKELDRAVGRLMLARFELGMFDPPAEVAYAKLPLSELDSDEHRALALQTAREAMVLLKNDGSVLPLNSSIKTLAVIGPNAASLAALEGNYNAIPSQPVTPLAGLRTALGSTVKVLYAQGSPYVEALNVPAPETLFRTGAGSAQAGLRAEYFSGPAITGRPVATRVDPHIDFDWSAASPVPGVPLTGFGVRWTGTVAAPAPGDYTFAITMPDCYPCNDAETYTVFLDGRAVAHGATDAAKAGRPREGAHFVMHFADGQPHAFRLEYTHASALFGAGITLNWRPPAAPLREEAVGAARQADAVVAFVGLSPDLEGEEMPVKVPGFNGGDRTDINLPAVQQQMLEAVAATGKPLIVVLLNGSALAVNWAAQHAAAVLEAWYPGEEGGRAIAETLPGTNNPAGRLPITFYRSVEQLPAFENYSMQGRTYRYFKGDVLYPFGAGLSYSRFTYSAVTAGAATIHAGESAAVTATVTNQSNRDGDEVVELYLTPPASPLAPVRALVGFQRLHLKAGESRIVTMTVDPRHLSQVDASGRRAVLPGTYLLYLGGHQPSAADTGATLTIDGSEELPE